MELRKVQSAEEMQKIERAVALKKLPYCTTAQVATDHYFYDRLYVVVEENKLLAILSLVPEKEYGYTAIKRLCILNKKNQGKGIARFALHEIQKVVHGKIGGTPWVDNGATRHLFETEGFTLQYVFNEKWCYYMKEV